MDEELKVKLSEKYITSDEPTSEQSGDEKKKELVEKYAKLLADIDRATD